jgi:hypothetical protein
VPSPTIGPDIMRSACANRWVVDSPLHGRTRATLTKEKLCEDTVNALDTWAVLIDEPPGSGKLSQAGSPILSQAGSPILSQAGSPILSQAGSPILNHPGAAMWSHLAGRDRIPWSYFPPLEILDGAQQLREVTSGGTEECSDRHPRDPATAAPGRARPAHRPRPRRQAQHRGSLPGLGHSPRRAQRRSVA